MEKTYFRRLFRPELERPVFVEGLPGFGNVGKTVAQLLIEHFHAKVFAEMYSPFFLDYVVVDSKGVCHPPHYEFYSSSTRKKHVIIMTGENQPPDYDVIAHYELCDSILNFVEEYQQEYIVTVGGMPMPELSGEVYVAATSSRLAAETAAKGALVYKGGKIIGATGLLLGLARRRGRQGVCLLGATVDLNEDQGAAFSIFNLLLKMLES